MIFYFSGNGNSASVAFSLGSAIKEKRMVNMEEALKKDLLFFDISNEEYLGFVVPTYFMGLPKVVIDFLDKMRIKSDRPIHDPPYSFVVSTYGGTSGGTNESLAKELRKMGLQVNARFGVKTVDTYVPIYDVSNKDKIKETLEEERKQVLQIIKLIKEKKEIHFNEHSLPYFISRLYYKAFYKGGGKTKSFAVSAVCVTCARCATNCVEKAIEIKEGKPTWIKERCTLCLRCLHQCPKNAITYTKKSAKHGQFSRFKTKTEN